MSRGKIQVSNVSVWVKQFCNGISECADSIIARHRLFQPALALIICKSLCKSIFIFLAQSTLVIAPLQTFSLQHIFSLTHTKLIHFFIPHWAGSLHFMYMLPEFYPSGDAIMLAPRHFLSVQHNINTIRVLIVIFQYSKDHLAPLCLCCYLDLIISWHFFIFANKSPFCTVLLVRNTVWCLLLYHCFGPNMLLIATIAVVRLLSVIHLLVPFTYFKWSCVIFLFFCITLMLSKLNFNRLLNRLPWCHNYNWRCNFSNSWVAITLLSTIFAVVALLYKVPIH